MAGCRKKLEEAGEGQSIAGFEAEDEQIPKLLAWARKAAHDEHTPWNCYVTESVEGAHHIKDEAATVRVKLDVDEDEGQDAWFALTATFDHGGVHLTEEEMRKLADEGREWFNKNGTWIHVDKKALATFDKNLKEARRRAARMKICRSLRPSGAPPQGNIITASARMRVNDSRMCSRSPGPCNTTNATNNFLIS